MTYIVFIVLLYIQTNHIIVLNSWYTTRAPLKWDLVVSLDQLKDIIFMTSYGHSYAALEFLRSALLINVKLCLIMIVFDEKLFLIKAQLSEGAEDPAGAILLLGSGKLSACFLSLAHPAGSLPACWTVTVGMI